MESLYQTLDIFSKQIWNKYQVQLNNNLTISGLSMEIFLKGYYNDNVPLITDKIYYHDFKEAYFGGITEVYKPTNLDKETLYYYDVNSL